MKLNKQEQAICDKYSAYDDTGHVHCKECPLVLDTKWCECLANTDGRFKAAKDKRKEVANGI